MTDSEETTDDTKSAPNATLPQLFYLSIDSDNVKDVKLKCNIDEEITLHFYVKVQPQNPDLDPLELLRMGKRLLMCTHCGNLRLTH